MDSSVLDSTMSEIQDSIDEMNKALNSSGTTYRPTGQNSNTYAGNAYESLTGKAVKNTTEIELLALDEELEE